MTICVWVLWFLLLQAAGFYHNLDTRPSEPYRNFNTWMGDPVRALQVRRVERFVAVVLSCEAATECLR